MHLVYLSFNSTTFQFAQRQIDSIGRDTEQPVATNVAAPFLMEFVPKYSTLMPRHSDSDQLVRTTSLNILLKRSYWEWPSNKFI